MSSAPAARGSLELTIARSDPEAQAVFEIDRTEPMTVLDALLAVSREHDPSLGFRYSCRAAMCGTCSLRANGASVLACQTPVPAPGERLDVRPLAGLPVLRDLVVDMRPFWRDWERAKPWLVPVEQGGEPARVRPDSRERRTIDPALDCIGCAICWSACDLAASERGFLGPAALNRAMVLTADSRDAAGEERLEIAAGPGGVDRCHLIEACSARCPKGLDPARAIKRLRRWRLRGGPG